MKKGILLLLFACNLMTVSTFAQIRYVKVGGTGNGSSWANASGSIQDMIDYTFSGGEVWVGEGTYTLSATLQMKEGVDVYGGFFGDETSIADRPKSDLDSNGTIEPWEYTHASVLNGQNIVQVVNQATDFSVETTWDGVTITNGKNTTGEGGGASIKANCILTNAVISNNSVNGTNTRGGGVYNSGGTIRNCIISNNTSSAIGNGGNSDIYSYGGGVYNLGGAVSNCVISNNTASSVGVFSNINYTYGGGIYNSGTISNCTISNNTVYLTGPSSQSKLYGGGICNANTSVLVRNCIVSNNTPAGYLSLITYGGGIYQGTIDSCTVTNNSATQGGGIYGSENISNCIVNGNTSKSYGGGIYNYGNNVTIANCIVSENVASSSTASPYGGGIYCSGSNATISNCIINGNTVSNTTASASYSAYGGGVYFSNTNAKIMDCIIKDNRTLKNELQGGYGGGIYQGIITRCRIEDNTSGEGGGFYGSSAYNCLLLNNGATTNGGGGFVATNGKSVNCTFVGNRSGRGGGIYFSTNTGTSAANCIFWHNYALVWEQVGTPSGSNAADVTYSAIQEQYPGTGNIIIAEDNESGGPLFFNNYNLQVNSPCINTGSNAILTLSDTTDLAGNIRIYDTIVDMGAYERQGIDPPTYIISGRVTYNGNPLAGVMMIHEGDSSLLTNASGEYSITVYQGANITLTPTKEGYGFFPPSVTFSNISNNIVHDFTSVMVISVANITNIPDTIFSRVPYTLSGVVVPNNATNQTIIWSVVSAGTTGATITGDTLNTTAEGTVTVMATIIDGITMGVNYVQNFSIVSSLNYYCNGNGTSSNPYQICTPWQLRAFAICINTGEGNTTSGKYYKLMNDIDLSIYDNWDPIGNNSAYNNTHRFQGNFDGNEKVVRNLTINNSSDYQGLFGYTINGTIQNLGIENCNVNGEEYVGGLLGYSNNTTISNCYSTGNVSGSSTCVGGLVGYATLSISNCYSTANVVGNQNVGGLVGYNQSNISNSYASGKIKAGGDYVGGLVGRQNYGNIKNCVAANDSIITTSIVSNISRVCGNNSGLYYNNYALNVMIIKEGNNSYYITGSSNTAGTSKSPVTLKSLSFYATTSNWYSTATSWSIADSLGIWNICNETSFPFFLWQNVECDSIIENLCGGSGTLAAPYEICNSQQFKDFADYINAGNGENTAGKYYKLMTDIDLSGYANWTPIGSSLSSFQGNFDGNAKVVRNLSISSTSNDCGLFGCIEGAIIQNLGIENCNISGASHVGAIVGYATEQQYHPSPSIHSCYATGYVKGTGYGAGGLVGSLSGTLINCFAAVDVEGENNVGGLVGSATGCYINNCYATGTVKGIEKVGGLVGYYGDSGSGNVSNSIAANDSVIATTNTTNVNRIFGQTNSISGGDYMYALNTMVVQSNNTTITITNNTATSGSAQSLTTLKSLSFYTTSSNWFTTYLWSIADPSGIWQICDGDGLPFLRWQGLTCGGFVPVTNITGVSTTTTANAPLTLTGTVLPSNATYQTITWSVQNAGTTGATIAGNTLNTTATGTVTVRATIANGTAIGINYSQDFTITVSNSVLGGTVSITGSAVFGETLTAVTTGLTSTPNVSLGTLSYQWKRSNTNIGTNSAMYVLVEEDINQTITVTVSAENCAGNVISPATAAVAKASQSAPALPTLSSTTTTSITLNEVSGCEYNINSGIWQSSAIFQGLTANTSYTFTQRKKETATHFASLPSEPAAFSTDIPLYSVVSSVNNTAFGTVTPYGETQVEEGSDLMFNITPYSNYVIDSVIVNGEFQGTMAAYTFTNVQSNCSLLAVFKREVGIVETEFSGVSVCPNPTRDELRITSDKVQIRSIEFFDVIGKKVFSPLLFQNSPEILINISHLQAGVYFVKISTEAGDVIKKVLKE